MVIDFPSLLKRCIELLSQGKTNFLDTGEKYETLQRSLVDFGLVEHPPVSDAHTFLQNVRVGIRAHRQSFSKLNLNTERY